jgi:hypothetical protein
VGEAASGGRRWRAAGYGLALAVLLGATVWLPRSPGRVAQPAKRAEHAPVAVERAADGLPIMSAGTHAKAPDEPKHPHPITPAHERIYRENNLVAALNLGVDLEDPSRIRKALAAYRAEYPEDAHRLQEGYAIIADCLEQLDDATRERAQRFWSTQIRSQTRRYVRRYCLERASAS